MMTQDHVHLAEAARRLNVPPAVLSSLRYRGLLDDIELSPLGHHTLVRVADLAHIDTIIRRHTRTKSIDTTPRDLA